MNVSFENSNKPVNQFSSVEDVWSALDSGQKVFWSNSSYQVVIVKDPCSDKRLFSNRGEDMLRVTCMSNWFGSRLEESELGSLFN